jgi:hypothetical protein
MKKLYLVLLTTLLTTMQLSAQTWQWTKPEPNGNLTPNSEHDDAHDVEVDASGNAYVLGDFLGSLFLNDSLRATGSGSYLAKYDNAGNLVWYKLIVPTAATGFIRATDLTVTAQGVFITGKYDPTGKNGGVISYDCFGGGTGTVCAYSIGGFSFNSGFYNETGFFVTRFDSNGSVVWNQVVKGQVCFQSYNASLYFVNYNPVITSDKDGNIICEFLYTHVEILRTSISIGSGTIPLPPPPPNDAVLIVFKMNDAGNLLWSNYAANYLFSYISNDCNSIIADNNGNIFLYGLANDGCAFGSNIFHTTEYIKNGTNSWSTFIAKISSSGVWEFAKDLINTNYSQGSTLGHTFLAVDNTDNVYALANYKGHSYGSSAIILGDTVNTDKTNTYLVKLNNAGNLIWHKGFGSNETSANSICFANNSLYVSGRLRNYVYGNNLWYFSGLHVQPSSPNYGGTFEYFISKANTDGDFQWATSFSGDPSASSFADGLAVKAFNGNVYTSGYNRGNITSLGNLNSNYTGDASTQNIFFGKLKDQYIKVGSVSANQVMPGCSITIPFTSTGLTFSATNKFTAELSDINWEFTNPTVIGTVKSTGTGSIKATIPSLLPVGTSGYKIRIRSSDTLPTGFNYFAYADTGYTLTITCPGVATGLNTTNITGTTATLNWAAVGCAAGYKIQYRVKGTTAWTTQNTTGNITSLALTGLTINTTYQWRMATKCKNGTTTSFSAYSPNQQFKTAAAIIASAENALQAVINEKKIWVQPNPAVNNSTVIFTATQANSKYTIQLTDLSGKTIWHKEGITVKGTNSVSLSLSLSKFAKSMYLVHVLINGEKDQSAMLYKN